MQHLTCSSCKKQVNNISGSTRFNCPKCAKHPIVRCGQCRAIAAPYTCPECNFEGPN